MDSYAYINSAVTGVLQNIWNATFAHLNADLPAAIGNFWSTNSAVAVGISWLQLFAAFLSALFVYITVTAVLSKRGLTAAVPAGEGTTGTAATTGGPLTQRWQVVASHLDSSRETDWKVAVIEADKLVDDALAHAGFSGETFGDRLANIAPDALLSLDGLWWAHKVRNRLAHEADYFLRYTEARQAIAYYEQTLRELNAV